MRFSYSSTLGWKTFPLPLLTGQNKADLNRVRLESIFHRVVGAAQLDLTMEDRFGNPVKPREWFLVPLQVIDEAVARIRDGSSTEASYDPQTARLVG